MEIGKIILVIIGIFAVIYAMVLLFKIATKKENNGIFRRTTHKSSLWRNLSLLPRRLN